MGNDDAREGIKIGVGLVITLIVIGIVFGVLAIGKMFVRKAENGIGAAATNMDNAAYTDYEEQTLSGSQVQSLLTQYAGQTVFVKTVSLSHKTTMYNYSSTTSLSSPIDSSTQNQRLANSTVKGKAEYIEPNGKFKCSLTRDKNNTIIGVTFTQQS